MNQPTETRMLFNKTLLKNPAYNPNALLDIVIRKLGLKNDAALSRTLGVAPPVISKTRKHVLPVGPCMVVRIMEETGVSSKVLRGWMGIR